MWPTVKEETAMELTLPEISEQVRQVEGRDSRRHARENVNLRMIVADEAGPSSGQVIDMTTRGCGLRVTKPLRRGQYLSLKVFPSDGTAVLICDLAKVQWVEEERAGVAFMCLSMENELRLHRLCAHQLAFQFRD
jgi:hypothetical protein